jgi:hypothetical protein
MATTVTAPKVTASKVQRGIADARRVAKTLGLKLPTGTDFPGVGKKIAVEGGGAMYVNRGYADVRGTKDQVDAWVKAGHGEARGNGTWIRVAFEADK